MNLSIFALGLNLRPDFQNKGGRLDIMTIFRWGLLLKMGVRFFMVGGPVLR